MEKAELEKIVDEAIARYPEKAAEYKSGKEGLLGLFVGETMIMTRGKADPKETTRIIREKLK